MDLLPTWNTGHGLRFRYSYRCMFLWQRDLWSDRHVDPRGWVKQERVWICWRGSNRWVATNMFISKVIPRTSSTNYHMSFVLCWVQTTEQIALKGAMTMPSLLLRKPQRPKIIWNALRDSCTSGLQGHQRLSVRELNHHTSSLMDSTENLNPHERLMRALLTSCLRVSYEWTLPAITVQPSLSVNVDHEINIVSVCEILTDKYPAAHRLASVAFWKLQHVQGVSPSAAWPNQREHDILWCPPGQRFCWSLQSGCRRMALHMHSLPAFKD